MEEFSGIVEDVILNVRFLRVKYLNICSNTKRKERARNFYLKIHINLRLIFFNTFFQSVSKILHLTSEFPIFYTPILRLLHNFHSTVLIIN